MVAKLIFILDSNIAWVLSVFSKTNKDIENREVENLTFFSMAVFMSEEEGRKTMNGSEGKFFILSTSQPYLGLRKLLD